MGPTRYSDLNEVLAALVDGARAALGADLVGAYLGGSFALGDADEHSDVDFVVITSDEITDAQLEALQWRHARLYELEPPWAQHLEGSYVPLERFRRLDPSRTQFWFLDNGARELVRDDHCNTAVTRWVLRAHGVTLVGPPPASLVEPVSADELRREAVVTMRVYAEWAPEPTKTGDMSQWKQPYLVLTCCRLLATLALGKVVSKCAAAEWAAAAALDPEWRDLIERAQEDRPDPWGRVRRSAEPALAQRTLAFVDYALQKTKGPLRGPSVQ